jgi:CheY-like chemotaxis protein
VDILTPRLKSKDVEMTCMIGPNASGIFAADTGRLRQVLLNLAGNAVKFTEAGNVALEADVVWRQGIPWMTVKVSDTGIGIPVEMQPRLFTMFMQADSSVARRFGGTGLGLAISQRIVNRMSGKIGFESRPGEGSTFWFEVPLRNVSPPEPELNATPLAGLRVLVVDDNAINREVFERQFASWGASVIYAVNGAEGLQAIRREGETGRIDLALIDHHMPGMSGLEMAAAIRSDTSLRPLPMILASSGADGVTKDVALAMGFTAMLTKPVRQSTLLNCLMEILHGKSLDLKVEVKPAAAVGSGLRILVAEDNLINQDVALGILSKLGYQAEAVGDGSQAVARVLAGNYDMVLMDMQMPGMDGLAATRAIRELPGPKAKTVIIAMTANAMAGDREICMQAGMDDYLSKPIHSRRLAAMLMQWSSRAARHTETDPVVPVDAKTPSTERVKKQQPLLDQEATAELRELLGEEAFRDILSRFVDTLPSHMEKIRTANNAAELSSEAHSLRGAAMNLGFIRLGGWLEQLQAKARSGKIDSTLLDKTVECAAHSIEELRKP